MVPISEVMDSLGNTHTATLMADLRHKHLLLIELAPPRFSERPPHQPICSPALSWVAALSRQVRSANAAPVQCVAALRAPINALGLLARGAKSALALSLACALALRARCALRSSRWALQHSASRWAPQHGAKPQCRKPHANGIVRPIHRSRAVGASHRITEAVRPGRATESKKPRGEETSEHGRV